MRRRHLFVLALLVPACGDDGSGPDAATVIPPTANPTREVAHTKLDVALDTRAGRAEITLAASDAAGASLEVGDLEIRGVTAGGVAVPFAVDGARLDLGVDPAPI